MPTTQAEFFQAHAVDGALTDAQMMELLQLPEGDMSTVSNTAGNGGVPDTTSSADAGNTNASTDQQPPSDPGAAPVVLAKDGVHTIPYEKLVEAREAERNWKAQAEAAQQAAQAAQAQLAALQAKAEQRADDGLAPTTHDKAVAAATAAIDAGTVDPELFGDFSEEAIAKGVQKLVAQQMQALKAEVLGAVQPLQAKAQETEAEKHFAAILEAHPDAQSVAESAELAAFIDMQPSFVKAQYQSVLAQGTSAQVVELLDVFKAANGKAQPPQSTSVADAAKAAIAKARQPVPTSLTDVPGSLAAPTNELDAMRDLSGAQLLGKFEGKTPEQISALLEKLV
jgi:hypothetical protein